MTPVLGRTRAGAGRDAPLAAGGSVAATAWPVLRAEARTGWRAWLALALLVGVAGAVVLTAAAGARRTSTAFPRLLGDGHAAQVGAAPNGDGRGYYDAQVSVQTVAGTRRMRIVGQAIFPSFGVGLDTPTGLGDGAAGKRPASSQPRRYRPSS